MLNLESRHENAFAEQEVLILRTLADLLATALHNAFVFQKMQTQAITDSLTGIKTRRFFLESVQAEWKRASRSGRPFSVVMVDLDRFKDINDTLGHLEGDLVLARIGRVLEQKSRQSNVVARYGGDEFVILMPETGLEQAQVLSERLRLWIATDPMLSQMKITGSFGVATYPLHGAQVEDILRVADAGMYISKKEGGDRVSMAEEFVDSQHLLEQRELVTAYMDGFLRRENPGPEAADELVGTLKKLGSAVGQAGDRQGLMQALRTLTRAAETREYSAGHGDAVARFAEAIGHELMLYGRGDDRPGVRGARARRGQNHHPGKDPQQARPAERRRVRADEEARPGGSADRRCHPRTRAGAADGAAPSRALRWLGLSQRPARRGDSAGIAHHLRRRSLRGYDHRARLRRHQDARRKPSPSWKP